MNQRRHSMRLLVAAFTALLTGGLVGSSGLVLCIGSDGHRALEREHEGPGCLSLASQTDALASMTTPEVCVDLPAAGSSPVTLSSSDDARIPTPPMAFAALLHEPPPRVERLLQASIDARAGPPRLAPHLPSTVLLV